jgi:putative ABC transport system permease protein
MTAVESLGLTEILLMLAPVAAIVALSLALRLGQARRISIATARSVVQLLAIGLIIGFVFESSAWYWVLGLLVVMTLVAGFTAAGQSGLSSLRTGWLLSLILGGVTGAALVYYTRGVVGIREWDARYVVPLGGMMLGNAMTAATLSVERIGSELARSGREVEAYLALGASPRQATASVFRRAVGAALTPTVNAMMVVGIVKLPGMMTGQMLGGTAPFQAAIYQLMILTAILFCDGLSATLSGVVFRRGFFTSAWQLDRDALRRFRTRAS